MAEAGPHLNDTGTPITVIFKNDGVAMDFSEMTVTTKQIKFRKPDGTVLVCDADWVTDGSDGKIKYVTVYEDFNLAGRWLVQGYIAVSLPEESAGAWHSERIEIDVFDNV